MKVFAVASIVKPMTEEQRKQIKSKEVPDTLKRYLDGAIEQFWAREDQPGVVFLLNAARSIIEALPLVVNGYLAFEYIPVGPLKPLALLIQSPQSR